MFDKKTSVLGDKDYQPTAEESKDIVENGKKGLLNFKQSIFYIWIYSIFKEEPYNCKNISQFVSRYFGLSRASFYRILNEIEINYILNGGYEPEMAISSFICQKLRRFKNVFGDELLIEFWFFLNHKQEEKITGSLIEIYFNMVRKIGRAIPISEFKKRYKDMSQLLADDIPKCILTLENKSIDDEPVDRNLNYAKNDKIKTNELESDNGESSDESSLEDSNNEQTDDSDVEDVDDFDVDDVDDNDLEDRSNASEGYDEKSENLYKAVLGDNDKATVISLNIGNTETENVVKAVILISKLNEIELTEIQNYVDQLMSNKLK